MTKKIVAVAMAMVLLMGLFAITVSAASYSTGKYTVTASNGVNVRSGAGTGYSKVGAATKNTTFTVSRVSGSWGYTSSIRCTNGVRSGWVSLDYCKYNGSSGGSSSNSNRATYNDVFASLKGQGYSRTQAAASESTSFTKGQFVYVWGFLHDVNDNLYTSYGSGRCDMTLSIYRPNGSLAMSYTYNNCSENWIGQCLDTAGEWKIESKITGSLCGTNTRTITVKEVESATYYTLSYDANGGYSAPSAQRVKANTAFYMQSSKPSRSGYTFLGWSTNRNATSSSYAPGTYVRINGNVTLYAVWKKNASVSPSSVSLNCSSCTMTKGSTKWLTATVYPTNASSKTVTWSSSNSQVVSVSSSGKLTAVAPGVATVTAKTSNGKTTTCKVTVKGVVINNALLSSVMKVGDVFYLSASVYPSNSTRLTWTSSNTRVVSVNSSGKMTAKAAGTAQITVKTSDGLTHSMTVSVSNGTKTRSGSFTAGTTTSNYTSVRLNTNAGNGKVRIYTYDKLGNKSNGEVHVVVRDSYGRWLSEFNTKSGSTLTLGDNNLGYRLYITRKQYPDTIKGSSDNFLNTGRCVTWKVECTSNCYIQ